MIEGQEGVTWDQWLALARAGGGAGLEGLFRSDHHLSIVRGGGAGSLDASTTLAALAARAEPIRVGGSAKPRTVRAAVRWADEYNTVFPSVERARERRAIVDEAARTAGREPLTFSMMTGCVVGRDRGETDERIEAWRRVSSGGDR